MKRIYKTKEKSHKEAPYRSGYEKMYVKQVNNIFSLELTSVLKNFNGACRDIQRCYKNCRIYGSYL